MGERVGGLFCFLLVLFVVNFQITVCNFYQYVAIELQQSVN